MDIWRWVWRLEEELREEGQVRLADLISLLPNYSAEALHASVDAVFPEALALARASGNPWLEIYMRHWHLQSKVLIRSQASDSIQEAVSLAEFAQRKENRDCPQGVCVTQDLTHCYALFDGPGYLEERLQACRETLDRIDATWPCYACVGEEYASALGDGGRHQEALDFIEECCRAIRLEAGREDPWRELQVKRWRIGPLLALGRLEEALDLAERIEPAADHLSTFRRARLDRCLALCALERFEEAGELLLDWDEVRPTPSLFQLYGCILEALARAGTQANDLDLHLRLSTMERILARQGVNRRAFDMALRRSRLALDRRRWAVADACLEEAESHISRLRRPLDAPALVHELRQRLEAERSDPPAGESPDDPEAHLDLLSGCGEEHHRELALAWRACGWPEKAYAIVQDFDLRGPWLLEDGRTDELIGLCRSYEGPEPPRALYLWGLALEERGDLEGAVARYREVLNHAPAAVNTRLRLASALRDLECYQEALEVLEGLCAEHPPGSWDWDRMAVATLLSDWERVRESAGRLGMELTGETGPIEEDWGPIQVRFDGLDWVAVRTGPVTATIVEMVHEATDESRYGDRVVFDARPLNDPTEDQLMVFPHLALLERGNYQVFALDGVDPGEEAVGDLCHRLGELRLQVVSNPEYRVGDDLPGFFGHLAVPREFELAEAHGILSEATAGWEHPWLWVGLVAALGLDEELERQNELARRYGIDPG